MDFQPDIDPEETAEWVESLEDALHRHGENRVQFLLQQLNDRAEVANVAIPCNSETPYVNTIHPSREVPYPGNIDLEKKIEGACRWNAVAMVVRGNKSSAGIGGHIATYASAASLYEIGMNHFFRGKDHPGGGDFIYFQGHASPGIYARAFLENRLTNQHLDNFRRELQKEAGLSSYPHPWLMPDFWEFPTVSMGLGPLMAIYHARFLRYIRDRKIKDTSQQRVFCFIGDGEVDEPETLGAINLASREKLDNLIFVINCNLQRLDGPVRGNGHIIQELEAGFRGAGWNVVKVIWGSEWDPLLAKDDDGLLVRRMSEVVDGQYQKLSVSDGKYIRENFFGDSPELLRMVEHLSDDEIAKLGRGGHDYTKVYNAYKFACENADSKPTVILAKTVKGYGLGKSVLALNTAHQIKKIDPEHLGTISTDFGVTAAQEELHGMPFYRPQENSPEMNYMRERRKALGGSVPVRKNAAPPLVIPPVEHFADLLKEAKEGSTTMAFNRFFQGLLRDKELRKHLVPIIPDETRTFGMEALFSQIGIYSREDAKYEPVDKGSLLYYKETKGGQLLEEGINEAGSMSSFIAAGTAYANLGINMVPMYIFYSMFGFQRIGDLIWAAGDSRCKGFLLGATAGRTTLNGEGLQHEDGHSQMMASLYPAVVSYDPAYAYDLAVIMREGMRRMYEQNEPVIYYLSVYNENYPMPAKPEGVEEGILKGMYFLRSREAALSKSKARPQIFGSGSILKDALRAQEILADQYGISSDVWNVTSYTELRRDALTVERWNRLHPTDAPRKCYVETTLSSRKGPFIAVSDWVKALPDQIARWIPGRYIPLGTDGFGRSESREALRRHFEIDAENTVIATLAALADENAIDRAVVAKAIKDLQIDSEKTNAMYA